MRIGIILAQRIGKTGSGIFTANLAQGLAAAGHHVSILCSGNGSQLDLNGIEVVEFPGHFDCDGTRYPLPGMSDVMPYESSAYSELSATQVASYSNFLRTHIESFLERDVDVVHVNHYWIAARVASDMFKAPIVVTVHGTDLEQWQKCPTIVAGYGLDKIDRVLLHYVSPKVRDQTYRVTKRFDRSGAIIPPPFREDIFQPPRVATKRSGSMYVGKLSRRKGLFELLTAYRAILSRFPNETLAVVGSSSESISEWRQIAEIFGVGGRVRWCGFISQKDLSKVYQSRRVLIIPSWDESFGIVAVEAASSGTMVVMPEYGGADYYLKHSLPATNLFLIEPLVLNSAVAMDLFVRRLTDRWCEALSTSSDVLANDLSYSMGRETIARRMNIELYALVSGHCCPSVIP